MRRVECVSHDASGPRVVADAVCAAYAEAPPSLQTCNMHRCAEYQVTGWSGVSIYLFFFKEPSVQSGATERLFAHKRRYRKIGCVRNHLLVSHLLYRKLFVSAVYSHSFTQIKKKNFGHS